MVSFVLIFVNHRGHCKVSNDLSLSFTSLNMLDFASIQIFFSERYTYMKNKLLLEIFLLSFECKAVLPTKIIEELSSKTSFA